MVDPRGVVATGGVGASTPQAFFACQYENSDGLAFKGALTPLEDFLPRPPPPFEEFVDPNSSTPSQGSNPSWVVNASVLHIIHYIILLKPIKHEASDLCRMNHDVPYLDRCKGRLPIPSIIITHALLPSSVSLYN